MEDSLYWDGLRVAMRRNCSHIHEVGSKSMGK
jgi:hypothetical protein